MKGNPYEARAAGAGGCLLFGIASGHFSSHQTQIVDQLGCRSLWGCSFCRRVIFSLAPDTPPQVRCWRMRLARPISLLWSLLAWLIPLRLKFRWRRPNKRLAYEICWRDYRWSEKRAGRL